MSAVLDFERKYAFIHSESQTSSLKYDSKKIYKVNEKLGLILAFIYYSLDKPSGSTFEVKNDVVKDVLETYLLDMNFVSNASDVENDEIQVYQIRVLNCNENINTKEGYCMMPLFVEGNSKIFYNMTTISADNMQIETDFVRDALNFFNVYIRDRSSCSREFLWNDPITSTALVNMDYDDMFALYILDKYLLTYMQGYQLFNAKDKMVYSYSAYQNLQATIAKNTSNRKFPVTEFNPEVINRMKIIPTTSIIPHKPKQFTVENDDIKSLLTSILLACYYINPEALPKTIVLSLFKPDIREQISNVLKNTGVAVTKDYSMTDEYSLIVPNKGWTKPGGKSTFVVRFDKYKDPSTMWFVRPFSSTFSIGSIKYPTGKYFIPTFDIMNSKFETVAINTLDVTHKFSHSGISGDLSGSEMILKYLMRNYGVKATTSI